MRNASIIFDVNAYFELCNNLDLNTVLSRVKRLREKEQMLHIDCFAAPSVLLELFAHLANPTDPYYERSKSSLLALHCHTQSENSREIKLIADSESLLAKLLFNYEYHTLNEKWKQIANILTQIYNNPDENNIARMRADIQNIYLFVQSKECQFISDMFNFAVKGLNSSATDWAPFLNDRATRIRFLKYINSEVALKNLAVMYVIKTHSLIGSEYNNIDLNILAEKVITNFAAALNLYLIILKRIAETGCDIAKGSRRNWVWDMQLMFYITQNTLNNKELYLVSSDREILKAAEKAGMRNKVICFSDYLGRLDAWSEGSGHTR